MGLKEEELPIYILRWLEKEMATHSGILAWEIPWTEEPGGLQPTGSQKTQQNPPQSNTSKICKYRFTDWHKWKSKICQVISDRDCFPPIILSRSLSHNLDLSPSWQLSLSWMSLITEVEEGVFNLFPIYNSISPVKSYPRQNALLQQDRVPL